MTWRQMPETQGAGDRMSTSAPRILLVEDNPVNREVAVGMLESLGLQHRSGENGWVAIEAMNGRASMRC